MGTSTSMGTSTQHGDVDQHEDVDQHGDVIPAWSFLLQDFADVKPGRQTKPMERAEKDFNLQDMVSKCSEWQQIKALVTESPHKWVGRARHGQRTRHVGGQRPHILDSSGLSPALHAMHGDWL